MRRNHFFILSALTAIMLLVPLSGWAISGTFSDPGGGTYWCNVYVSYVSSGKSYSWCTGKSENDEMNNFRGFESEHDGSVSVEHPTVMIKFRFHHSQAKDFEKNGSSQEFYVMTRSGALHKIGEWTIYGGNNDFYMPAPDEDNNINNAQLMGGFTISDELYDGSMPDLEDGGYYPFSAITHCVDDDEDHWRSKKAESAYWDPFTDSGIAPYFTVYPLTLPEEPIVTSTPTILRDHPNSTQRYNLWGQPVSADHKGIVIHNGKLHLTPPYTQ